LIPLAVGTVLALGTLSFVLYPLLVQSTMTIAKSSPAPQTDAQRNPAIDALREIEFDRETGKLSDGDYAALRTEYMQRAVTQMRAGGAPICSTCGPRPESDAIFCSNCGTSLGVS
jgi:hypothetical protein